MYCSHPVRRLRDDPTGETATLVVTAETDQGLDRLEKSVHDCGAVVEDRLRFGAIRVTVPESLVADLCTLDGIESIETAATREPIGGDAGEDG